MKALEELGLTKNEAKVYLALLELGSTLAGRLISKVGLYRGTVYTILGRLMEKGLVSFVIKSNRKYFEAVSPEHFYEILKDEEKEIKSKKELLKEALPELIKKKKAAKEAEATIYRGKKGIISIMEDVIKEGKTIYLYGGGGNFQRVTEHYYELWHKKRKKKGLKLKILYSEKLRRKKAELRELPLVEMKFLPKYFDNPAPAMIYGDKVVLIVWSEPPIATMIKSKEVAKAHKTYFDLLWKISSK